MRKYVVLIQEYKSQDWLLQRMMKIDDEQLYNQVHRVLDRVEGTFDKTNKLFTSVDGRLFKIYPDWSCNEIVNGKELRGLESKVRYIMS